LKVLTADNIRLEMKDASRPGLLREGTEYLYVLMPVSPKD
jgi:DNA polymerase III sliding clamp (beta) subunit (PCNA family)